MYGIAESCIYRYRIYFKVDVVAHSWLKDATPLKRFPGFLTSSDHITFLTSMKGLSIT